MILTRTLLSLSVGLALIAPTAQAAFVCPSDQTELTPIPRIQGSGTSSPLATEIVKDKNGNQTGLISKGSYKVRATVTTIGESLTKGFYLTDPDGDNDTATSDGIFVFLNDIPTKYPDIKPGADVCLEAKVEEFYGGTQLKPTFSNNIANIQVIAQDKPIPKTPLRIAEGETLTQALNRHEGMRVILDSTSDLQISRNFSFDYGVFRNNMLLAHKAPLIKPTQLYQATSDEAKVLATANQSNRLVVESDYKALKGVIPWFTGLDADQGYLRIGDIPTRLEGVVVYNRDAFRLVVPKEIKIGAGDLLRTTEHDRQPAPPRTLIADLRIASFNVLNYFTSHPSIGGDLNITCKDEADAKRAKGGCNRGAKTQEEFEKQRTKIVNAITEMDADLLGLMEMENNGFGDKSAIQNLINQLNQQQKDRSRHYAYIKLPANLLTKEKFFGGDAIMVAMLYRPALLTPKGEASTIQLPIQKYKDEKGIEKLAGQRDSLMQTFTIAGSKEPLTLVVNHLKSKGSGCLENGDGKTEPADLQGKCTELRVSAAKVLGEAASKVSGPLLLVGDFNAYAKEDPIRVMTDYASTDGQRKIRTAAQTFLGDQVYEQTGSEISKGYGLIDLNARFNGKKAISYSYDGELGTLDYALANPALAKRAIAVADWHINSYESNMFEYGKEHTGALLKSDNPFSASDHDPIIVDLKFKDEVVTPEPPVKPQPPITPEGRAGKSSSSGAGALGFGLLALLPLVWRRRR